MSHSTLSLSLLDSVPRSLVESGRAAKLVAEVLVQCQKVLGSEEAVKALWRQSRLGWDALGVREEDLGEFLADQGLHYLCAEVVGEVLEAPYVKELQQCLASDMNNKKVSAWIKIRCSEKGSPQFTRTLTRAVVRASVIGSGTGAIFRRDLFEKRIQIVKETHNFEHGMEVLNGLQVEVVRLAHPPKLLGDMFDIVYNTEVVNEDDLKKWYEEGTELFGRGNAVVSVRSFFEWLQSDSEDTPNPT